MYICPFFFFSSRRRHTRFKCDWSSDVCSSDLTAVEQRILGDSGTPKTGPGLVGQFWELDSDRILKLVLREIILSQEIQMPPGGRRAMGRRLQQFLPFGWIIDLGEFLRQLEVIPADDAILDEPFAGFGHLLVFLLRLQEFAWIADHDRAREGMDMLAAAEHLFNGHAQSRLLAHSQHEYAF